MTIIKGAKTYAITHSWRNLFIALGCLVLIGFGVWFAQHPNAQSRPQSTSQKQKTATVNSSKASSATSSSKKTVSKTVDWTKPSQTKAYPTVTTEDPVVLTVDLAKQRVYITQKDQLVYTMYCSTGINDSTPHGTFHIIDRGANFYNPTEKMGANYWTSFKGNTYLFHTVPTDENGKYITSEAVYLGKKPSSHGCVRLSIPDAKWINEHVPGGTKVVIK
ncbi:L,D-transpeptidase family protein [Lacticaseibacillus manihotivorans]|uniref:L,D-transpeptidase family protein n=1 Tax=Lacticaseibacillus manihotivorans TaxID=88233 RepID=A0A5P8JMW8_9LACO|nr:L,D-transpeptidase [Lacticaseibacillus manihotivorans]QFQ90051.1 L,D-transpeptidase family protein [Lacticaseibacillus manihotivorans]